MAKTLQDRLNDLKKEFEQKEAEIRREGEVLEALPPYALEYDPFIHIYRLYGRVAAIHFRHHYYESIRGEARQPDLDLIAKLAGDLPPLPMLIVKDSYTAFMPKDHFENEVTPQSKENAQYEEIAPYTIRIDETGGAGWYAKVEWTAALAGRNVEIEVEIPVPRKLGWIRTEVERYRDGEINRVTICEFSPTTWMRELGAQRIKFASGGPKYFNHFTVYLPVAGPSLKDLALMLED
jgi:hypothetical protein